MSKVRICRGRVEILREGSFGIFFLIIIIYKEGGGFWKLAQMTNASITFITLQEIAKKIEINLIHFQLSKVPFPFAFSLLPSLPQFLVLPIFFPQSNLYNLSAFWLQNIYKVKFHRLMKDQIVVSMTGFVRDCQ